MKIPKIIFIYWHDDTFPKLIDYNFKKIKLLHHDYKVNILNNKNYSEFLDIEIYKFNFKDKLLSTPMYFSDILRILLLEKYGGIWIDASLIFWKRVDNIVTNMDEFVIVRNYNNDNYPIKGYESWFIAVIPNHPFINKVKSEIVKLNTYNKIEQFLKKNIDLKKTQKNVRREYHLIYHIFSFVQINFSESILNCTELDSDLFYPNNYIHNFFDFPFTNANTAVINHYDLFNFLAAKKIENYIKNGEPKKQIASKLTYEIRKHIKI